MKKLKFGLIGCGRIGLMHAKNIINLISNAELIAVSDKFMKDKTKKELIKLDVKNIFLNENDVINHKDVEAIFIASPTFTHIELIRKIININNKPIFCEKPISIRWEDLVDLEKEVAKKNTILQLGYNRRFDVNFKKIKESVRKDEVGKQYLITITSFDSKPPKAKFVKESGMLWTDMNIHDFDMIRFITGSEIEKIFVSGANLISEELKGIDVDVSVINLKLSNGALGVIKATRKSAYGYDQRIEILGEKGRAKIENTRPTTFILDTVEGRKMDNPFHTFMERYTESYVKEIKSFITAVEKKQKPKVSIIDDLMALKVARAAEISYKENRVVDMSEIK